MDIKGACGYVSKEQFFDRIIELRIDGDLITWMGSFLTNRKIQLVINKCNNKKRVIEIGIPQDSLVLPILCLIYIGRVFDKIEKTRPLVMSLSFVDDLCFITSDNPLKEIVKVLEKVVKKIIE